MTNLSKELCEICEIERKGKLIFRKRDWDGKTWISAGHGYKKFDFKSAPETSVDIIPTKDYRETNGFQYPYTEIEKIKEIYNEHDYDFVEFKQECIDFTTLENFVKLLEIVSKKSSVSFCHNGSYFGCNIHYMIYDTFEAEAGSIQYNFLNTLLKQHFRNPCIPKLLERVKEAIRETEWKYE